MTDSHGKTKANSTIALNQLRRSSTSMINATIIIKDDTDNISDSDAHSVLKSTSKIDMTAKNSLKSPWKDEMVSQSDLCSEQCSSVLPRATPIVASNTKKKNMTPSRTVRNISIRKSPSMTERSIKKSNQSSLYKSTSKRKSSKYHWSGTFRSRKNLFRKDTYCNSVYSPHESELNENDQLMTYDYNCENFTKEKFTGNKDIYYPNEFGSRINDDSQKEWIGCQPCIDICRTEFDGFDNFNKDYDIEQNDGILPGMIFDIDRNFRPMTDIDNKDNYMYNIDSRANERDNATIVSRSPFVREFASSSILSPKIESTGIKNIKDIKKKSNVQSRRYRALYLLLSFFKNIFLFSLLPAVYITFFIYVQGTGN